jgi:hypothetical protein
VRPGVVGGVAVRWLSGLRPSLRLRWPATPLEYRCQGDISISVTVHGAITVNNKQ